MNLNDAAACEIKRPCGDREPSERTIARANGSQRDDMGELSRQLFTASGSTGRRADARSWSVDQAVEQGRFGYERECWLCPYCGSEANVDVCSGCDERPSLKQFFGEEPLRGRKAKGRPRCKHPQQMRSKTNGQCLECRRLAGRRYRDRLRDEKSSIPAAQEP
jgi:hypothetical protein